MLIVNMCLGLLAGYVAIKLMIIGFGWLKYWLDGLGDWMRPPRR